MNKVKILLFTLLLAVGLNAQNNIFDLPLEIEQPEWYKKTDWNNPNIYQIEELIKNEPAKLDKKTTKSDPDEEKYLVDGEEFEEDPYVNAYRRWKEQLFYAIQIDGSLIIDPEKAQKLYEKAFYQSQKSNPSGDKNLSRSANWTALGPMETFSSGSMRNSQVNCRKG